ncbi:MAG: ABC transporter ATP-binding protein [Chloroflexi bacterium]|nr:ABC transporter ATP-binding protein [Chloroflexota bacterium]
MERNKNNFIRFLAYVRPYWKYVALGSLGGIVKFTVPLFVPQVTQYLLDDVFLNKALTAQQQWHETLVYVGGLMLVFIFFWTPWTYVRHYHTTLAGEKAIFDLRCDLYYHILRMSASFFARNRTGSVVSRLTSDVLQAQNLVGSALTNVWMDTISLVVILYFLVRINWQITLVALCTMPFYLYAFKGLGGKIRSTSHDVQESISVMSGRAQEKIAGSVVVHAFAQEKQEEQNFWEDSKKLFDTTMLRARYQSYNMVITGVLIQIAPLIVLAFGGYQVIHGAMTVGELVAVSLYLTPLYTPLQRFSDLNVVFGNSMAALDRIYDIIDEAPDIHDNPGAVELEAVTGRVTLDHVYFSYRQELYDSQDGHGPVLQDLSMDIQPGMRVALVGPSGSGKSTLVSLIPRFYDVKSGAVRIDGHDVRQMTLKSLRRHVGIVLQSPILFSGTMRQNIRYGKPDATQEEIVAACKAANAYDFIMKLPDGFLTEAGEGGQFLSGGQRQRLTIARAFLKDPKILILDEATSALDVESERLVQEALKRLMENRTTFIIAHRLSTIVDADLILVLDNGRIVETGNHHELLRQGGLYRELYKTFETAMQGPPVLVEA